jgi:hypothetical protein
MFSRFKTLKDIVTAKNLEGDDAIAQRAVIVIQNTIALKERAYYVGHKGGYLECDDVIVYAGLALGGLDRTHRYGFLNDVSELKVDVRLLADANQEMPIGSNEADELVTHAEVAYEAIDEKVPVPSVIIKGLSHQFIYRGAHCEELVANLPPVANSNFRGLRTV